MGAAQILTLRAVQNRDAFLAWQCRLRQTAMRRDGGRPSAGMRPRAIRDDGGPVAEAITVLLVEADPSLTIDILHQTIRRSADPRRRYQSGLSMLSAAHYQDPRRFSDVMTALFPAMSTTADALLADGYCVLSFEEEKRFDIRCDVVELDADDLEYQFTCLHNQLFNPNQPPDVRVLAFHPDWTRSTAA